MHRGYIKLWRCIEDNDLWQEKPFDRARAWIDLIRKARHEDGAVWIRGIEMQLEKGQLAWSEAALAQNWGWSRNKVRRFLKMLKTKHQIEQENNNVTNVITIKNYDMYNSNDQQVEHQVEHQVEQQKDTKRNTKKNEYHYKNEKNNNTMESKTPELSGDESDKILEMIHRGDDVPVSNVKAMMFTEFKRMSKKNKTQMTTARSKALASRLKEFGPLDIRKAWAQMATNNWLRGDNDRQRDFLTFDYALRPDRIEHFLHEYERNT